MKYFVRCGERRGTCYHEFFAGEWDGKTFWKEDSLLLHDDVLSKSDGFWRALAGAIAGYDPFAAVAVSRKEWETVGALIDPGDDVAREMYREANEWVESAFASHGRFTILGI
ncbi:MAG: hypothetical protein Q4A66_08855 [Eubacteriales bacterium]|nr:hypothetical protein [Eubacteriales bacterium]